MISNLTVHTEVYVTTLQKTVSDGYFRIENGDVPTGFGKFVIQSIYSTGKPLNLIYTVSGNIVYVRKGDGSEPTEGTVIYVRVIAFA